MRPPDWMCASLVLLSAFSALHACAGGGGSSAAVIAATPLETPTARPTAAASPTPASTKTATPAPSVSASPTGVPTAAPTHTPAPTAAPTATPTATAASVCLNGSLYGISLAQQFNDPNSWRINNGGKWFTEYQFGRTNPGADDAAYYMDKSLGLGNPVYDPFSITASPNGNLLAIEAQPVSNVPGLLPSQIGNYQYVSGLISTSGVNAPGQGFAQRYGYYEVAAQLPKGQGIWPSFWMLDVFGSRSEIDVFEFLGNDTSTIYQSVHYVNGTGGSYPYHGGFDPTAALHRYGVLVTPTTDYYYVDGAQTHSVPDASVNTFYFMVSLQIGGPGSWPGPPDSSTVWPVFLYLQYFHAYAPLNTSC